MNPRVTTKKVSPMRMLRSWLFREWAVRGPAAIELAVVERQVNSEEEAVRAAAGQSTAIERRLANVRQLAHSALNDAQTPGVIDAGEANHIARELISTSVDLRKHTETLEALA